MGRRGLASANRYAEYNLNLGLTVPRKPKLPLSPGNVVCTTNHLGNDYSKRWFPQDRGGGWRKGWKGKKEEKNWTKKAVRGRQPSCADCSQVAVLAAQSPPIPVGLLRIPQRTYIVVST
jgi:hypothetical protein